jgi:hypothetical protein
MPASPRLVPSTTVRSRRISRQEDDSQLCVIMHQERLPYLVGRKSDEGG